jgi:hypothetical protein
MSGTSAVAVGYLVARMSKTAVVVVGVVRLDGIEPATDHSLVGEQNLIDMAQEVRTRAVSDAARMTEDLGN